ncbi:MAG: hypothetical protein JSR17_03125, partial [Proteobacteria bacterium]|nr:hypothetical protein [Pseudomonadota bacterium]
MIEAPNTDSFEESDTTSEEKVLVKMGKKGHQWSKPNMFCVSLGDLLDVKDSAKHLSDHKINIPLNETAKTFIKEFVHEILETDDEKFLKNGRINFSLKAQKEYVEEKFKTFKSSLESDFDALNPIYVQKMEDENKRRKRKINKKNDFYEIAKVEFYEIFSRILADKIVHVIHSRKIPFPEIKTTEQEAVSNYVMMNGKVQSDKNPVRDINETGQLTKQGHFRTRVIEPFTYKVISKSFRTHVMGAAGELIPISPYTAWTDPRLKNRFCGYIFTLIKDYLLKGAYIATWRREFLDDDLFLLTLKRRIGVGKFSIEATL